MDENFLKIIENLLCKNIIIFMRSFQNSATKVLITISHIRKQQK